jgi:hypothetical protein
MARKQRHTPEQVIDKLREAEVKLAKGTAIAQVCKDLAITENTYYRWRHEYGGLKLDQARRLKELEKENGRPKRLLAEAELDKAILYENLSTTIEDNGRKLKARLEEVGLKAGHGKTLDIAAHSMGGLVSRWFIEREGGNQIARRLVMLGTPNGRSPWPRMFDWATVALALGLNHLTAIPWPASVVGWLAARIENPTVALHEMLSGSKVLADLRASADPGIPYVVLAGNTSIIPAATQSPDVQTGSLLGRLLARLTSPGLLHEVANPFFLDQANDIAVSVASMENIAPGRKPSYDVRPVACDHLSYFRDPAGVRALASVLAEGF